MEENQNNNPQAGANQNTGEPNPNEIKLDPRKPKEALAILDRATATLSGPRQAHLAVIQALQTLSISIKELEEIKEKN